jgi:Tfp pilus assembly protein PilO
MDGDLVKKAKKIIYTTAFAMVAVIGLATYFFVIPSIKKAFETKDEFEEKKLIFEGLKDDAANSQNYDDLLENIKENQALLENALIEKGDEVIFIEKIESVAEEVGSKIEIEYLKATPKRVKIAPADQSAEALAQQKEQEKQDANRVVLMLKIDGNYRSFLEFLYKIENMPYVFRVESVEIGKGSKSGTMKLGEESEPPDFTQGNVLISFIPAEK